MRETLRAQAAAAYRRVRFPLFGLSPSWQGSRWIGGYGGGEPLQQFTLAHGGPWNEPTLRVTSHLDWPTDELVVSYGGMLDLIDRDSTSTFEELIPVAKALPWESVNITVDGRPVVFELLRNGDDWMAWAWCGDVLVDLDGRGDGGFPLTEVELVTVSDASTYIDSSYL